ncbi:hypothetical protein DFJ43DRAFT_1162435 [Lentinula guzmanii]|uniref:Uncharacterized protein n=1 Tax=Lentinula guzmanii TaxID=2804957 RepID=A0AA38J600_9AGAR|nr:hypothetical protein DFJ43DRAFT_1162435 [Lentinula guzmanii]
MVDTSERKGRGKGKSRGVQKGKGKANGKREEEEASDSEIETEAAVEASALELEDSASRPPLQLPLRSPSQEKSQTLAHEVIPSTIVPPATLCERVESTEEKVNQKNPQGNGDQAQAGGPGDAPERNLQKQSVNTTKDALPEASLPEDNEVKSCYACARPIDQPSDRIDS